MKSKRIISWNVLLASLIAALFGAVMNGCSDDKDELQGSQYGYVQFKLYKSASYVLEKSTESGASTRANLDKLSEAQKIELEMQYNGRSIIQTLVLNSYNDDNAEYGMRSDKLQLLVGEYRIVGYKLLNNLDEEITGYTAGSDDMFTIVSRGLTIKDLTADAQARGTVTFRLSKTGLSTRANGDEYLFKDIKIIDLQVMNTFTRVTEDIKGLKVTYEEGSVEHQNPDNPNDKYMDTGTAVCDSAIWLTAGTYRVTSYTTYSKTGAVQRELETATVSGEEFTISDNSLTEYANVPVKLSETAEYIKDYKALKKIWEALGGKNWGYYGIGEASGTNWNFNKELDMWGNQPGVTLDSNGRITGITLEGFGASGRVPDAIGQLTELKILALGSHSEKVVSGKLFNENRMKAEQIQEVRMDYKKTFLDYDPRENLSELLQDGINRNPNQKPIKKSNRITLKDTQIGGYTNNITFISKAVLRLKNLQQFYIANSPILAEDIAEDWENTQSEYAIAYENEDLGWEKMTELTDIELYNCSELTKLPDFLKNLPNLQVLNAACNKSIQGEQLKEDWEGLIDGKAGSQIQILYLSYNNLEKFPENLCDADGTGKMEKLGLLDCAYNNLSGELSPLGSNVTLTTLTLNNNSITKIPKDFCGFTDQVETLDFSHNALEYLPNIFNAKSVYVMGSVNFSYNKIGSKGGKNFDPSEVSELDHERGIYLDETKKYNGINASTVTLSYNEISEFPTELFQAESPITIIDLSNNRLTKIPQYSLTPKDGKYKNTYMLTTIDLRFNKLTELSDDFRATTLPYLSNMDVGYNCFSKFPTQPLNSSQLQAFGIRHQRNEKGERTLREWPEGITSCPSLIQLQIGSNDIRKVEETMTAKLYIVEIKDNPNISIDMTSVCSYIEAGMYMLIYDDTQDIRGCDALNIK